MMGVHRVKGLWTRLIKSMEETSLKENQVETSLEEN